MNYGEVIQQLRKKANMTQAELGEKMNVSGQAVSKWENGLSQPDFETVRKCCELFHITMDDFSKMMKGEEIAPAAAPARAQDGASFLGVCTKCGKAIGPDDLGESSPHLLCKDCVAARKKKIAGEVKFQREKHRRRVVAGSGLLCLRQGRVHGRQGGPAGLAGFQVFLHRRPALL